MKAGEVALGSLVEAKGQPAPLFDPIDAAFSRVALFVEIWIMADRAATARAELLAIGCLIGLLRDDGLDMASAQIGAVATGGVRLVSGHRIGTGARAADGQADLDAGQDGAKLRAVSSLAWGKDEGQWTTVPVGRQMDLAGQSTA